MSIELTLICDKCEAKTKIEAAQGNDVWLTPLTEVPRMWSLFVMPEGKHICFECALYVMGEAE